MSSPEQPKRPKRLTAAELRKVVMEALEKGWPTGWHESSHARFDYLGERDIDVNDVLHGLEHPSWTKVRCKDPDDFNEQEWQWNYEIDTQDVEQRGLTIRIAVDPRNKSFEIVSRWHIKD
jgi:hypothetical protein